MKSKTEAKHSPTPWSLTTYGISACSDSDDKFKVVFAVEPSQVGSLEEAKANAAFIVRAVNNFQPMLDALKQLQIIVDAQDNMDRLGIMLAKVIQKAEKP